MAATGSTTASLLVTSKEKPAVRPFATCDVNGSREQSHRSIALADFAPWTTPDRTGYLQQAQEFSRDTMPECWSAFIPESAGDRVLLLPMDWGIRSGFLILTTNGSTDIARVLVEEIGRVTTNPVAHWVTRRSLQRVQNNRLATLLKHSADVVVVLNETFNLTYASPMAVAAMGIKPKVGGGFVLTHSVLSTAEVAAFTEGVQPGQSRVSEIPLTSIAGDSRIYRLTMTNLLNDPEVHGWLVNAQDVTDRVSSERESIVNAKRRSAIAEATTLLSNSTLETIVQDLAKPLNSLCILTNSLKGGIWLSEPGENAKSIIELIPNSTLPLGANIPDLKREDLHRLISSNMDLVGPGDPSYKSLLSLINVPGAPIITCGMFLPIRINAHLRGVAVLTRFNNEPYEQTDIDTARSIGTTISGALSRCEAISQLAIQARTDALTGLANRRALDATMEAIAIEVSRLPRVLRHYFVMWMISNSSTTLSGMMQATTFFPILPTD